MLYETKREMRNLARVAKGLTNALQSDIDYISTDVANCDLVCMGESIREAKDTLQRLIDNIMYLEELLMIVKREDIY